MKNSLYFVYATLWSVAFAIAWAKVIERPRTQTVDVCSQWRCWKHEIPVEDGEVIKTVKIGKGRAEAPPN